jgi:hypothetical protein
MLFVSTLRFIVKTRKQSQQHSWHCDCLLETGKRCGDLMVADNLIDIQESSIPMWIKGWRCVSCGNIIGPLIQQYRMIQRVGAVRLLGTEAAMPRLHPALKATA